MIAATVSDCDPDITLRKQKGSQDQWLEGLVDMESLGARKGWYRLIQDVLADEHFDRAKQAVTRAAMQIDLLAESAQHLSRRMLPCLRRD